MGNEFVICDEDRKVIFHAEEIFLNKKRLLSPEKIIRLWHLVKSFEVN